MTALDWSALARVREVNHVDARVFRDSVEPLSVPAVLRGVAADWPLVAAGRESAQALCRYIGAFDPAARVRTFVGEPSIEGRFFYSDDVKGFNFERRELALEELLSMLLELREQDLPPSIYAGAVTLRDGLARLGQDNALALVDPALEQLVSIWIGNRCRTAAHWDLPRNIACVAAGRRRFTLFPPDQLANLYVGPLDFTLAGQPISMVDFHAVDDVRFPRFRDALTVAQVAVLEPGDALYIPSMWFHHVESLDALSVLVNVWWRDAAAWMPTPLLTMLHALLTMRDMPREERVAWKTMFDHYIFALDETPMAHLPEDARGVFGPMTPERVARLQAHLIRSLGGQLRESQ